VLRTSSSDRKEKSFKIGYDEISEKDQNSLIAYLPAPYLIRGHPETLENTGFPDQVGERRLLKNRSLGLTPQVRCPGGLND